jgi:hypothetical protein
MFLNCLYRKPEQTAFMNLMQCKMVIIGVSSFILLEKATIICLVVLQICLDFVEGTTGSWSETCVTGDVDGTEEISIKIEEAIDIKDEMPEAVKCSAIKAEDEVRLLGVFQVVAARVFSPFIAIEANVELHLTFSCCMLCCECCIDFEICIVILK